MTLRTLCHSQELVGPLLAGCRIVVLHHLAQVLDDTVERNKIVAGGVYQLFVDAHVVERAIEYLLKGVLGDVFDGCLQRTFVFLQNGINLPEDHLILVFS